MRKCKFSWVPLRFFMKKYYLKVIYSITQAKQNFIVLNISARQFPGKWTQKIMKWCIISSLVALRKFVLFFFFPKINVGCSTDSSSADPVRLEFSRDFGATWHLLLPLCYHSSSHVSSLCSTEHHPSSTYYAGTTQGWRREVVHFGKLHLCG